MSRGGTTINYLILLLVVLIGVAGGNLVSNWVTAKIVEYRAEQAGASGSKRGTGMAIPMPGDLMEQAREQRRRDRDGVRLARACDEWRQANAQLNSHTTDAEMKKHCGLYERYVRDGVLPAKK